MHHKRGKHDLQRDMHQLVDVVAPRVESAVNTVAEKAPPLVDRGRVAAGTMADRGRTMAVEKGTLLAERLPDSVVDRLPESVADQLPVRRRGRGKKMLLLGLIGALVAAGVAAARRAQASTSSHDTYTPPAPAGGTATGPTAVPADASETQPIDPLADADHQNGRFN